MEYLFTFLLELALEGCAEASKSKRVPKYIRYPLIAILSLGVIAVIGLIFLAGVLALKEYLLAGIFLIGVGVLMLVMCVCKCIKAYRNVLGR